MHRYFHEALPTAAIAQEAIELILGLYRVEHDAKAQEITGSKKHLRLRRQRAGRIREQLHEWLLDQKPRHPPKSPISTAIRYALNQWRELGRFLDDARVPLDNNASERSLRRVALGRKNYLFVGDVEAGKSIAGLYTLVSTCEARGINPFAYLADVIPRAGSSQASARRVAAGTMRSGSRQRLAHIADRTVTLRRSCCRSSSSPTRADSVRSACKGR